MESPNEIKDKTKRLVYYLATEKLSDESPLKILRDLREMSENEMRVLSQKKEILNEIINEELENLHLEKLVKEFKNKKNRNI